MAGRKGFLKETKESNGVVWTLVAEGVYGRPLKSGAWAFMAVAAQGHAPTRYSIEEAQADRAEYLQGRTPVERATRMRKLLDENKGIKAVRREAAFVRSAENLGYTVAAQMRLAALMLLAAECHPEAADAEAVATAREWLLLGPGEEPERPWLSRLSGPWTLQALGSVAGISRERVRQREEEALRKLQKAGRKRGNEIFGPVLTASGADGCRE